MCRVGFRMSWRVAQVLRALGEDQINWFEGTIDVVSALAIRRCMVSMSFVHVGQRCTAKCFTK